MTVSDSIKSVFQSVDFKSRVEDALMYIPEIKLEPHLNNLLGIELKKRNTIIAEKKPTTYPSQNNG